jgi:hypothetical protein
MLSICCDGESLKQKCSYVFIIFVLLTATVISAARIVGQRVLLRDFYIGTEGTHFELLV